MTKPPVKKLPWRGRTVAQPKPPQPHPPGLLSWEANPPLYPPVIFTLAAGAVVIRLSYAVYREAILLYAVLFIPNREPELWRRHWTSYVEAVGAAENLVGDCEEYLQQTLGLTIRPFEDLDCDNYIEHLRTRINHEFH